jgi:5-methylcytosine-specific restriction endonuclease McrA
MIDKSNPGVWIYPSGRIRLTGEALRGLRDDCWARDKGTCQECGIALYKAPRFFGDPQAYDMAHIKSRGAGGSDTLENVRALCHRSHMEEHQHGLKTVLPQ